MSHENRVVVINTTEQAGGSVDVSEVVTAIAGNPALLQELTNALRPYLYPGTQPSSRGLWLDNGVLTYWSGVTNHAVDFNEGPQTSVFGTPMGDV